VRFNQRVTTGFGALVLVAASTLGLASPSHAATTFTRGEGDCLSGSGETDGAPLTGIQAGDVLDITGVFTDCGLLVVSQALVSSAASVTGTMSSGAFPTGTLTGGDWLFFAPGGTTFTSVSITLAGTGSGLVQLTGLGGPTMWSVSGSGGGGSASASAPAPILQQFGKPASSTCDSVAPTSLNWSGVASGGWSESWAQWMNGGNGGAVCTRTLTYSTSQSKWIVG
jgi:hypothetical protein